MKRNSSNFVRFSINVENMSEHTRSCARANRRNRACCRGTERPLRRVLFGTRGAMPERGVARELTAGRAGPEMMAEPINLTAHAPSDTVSDHDRAKEIAA